MKLKQADIEELLTWIEEAQKVTPLPEEAKHVVAVLKSLEQELNRLQKRKLPNIKLELTAEVGDA